MVRRLLSGISLMFLLFSPAAVAKLSAELDRVPVTAGESFTLILSLDQDSQDEPDLNAVSQLFQVLGTSSVRQQQVINGQASDLNQRLITLRAEQPGTYHIPSIRWSGEDSAPIEVRVVAASERQLPGMGEPLFMRAEVDRQDPYVQSQVLLTVRVYYAMQIYNKAEFRPLVIEHALVEPLGKESQYQTQLNGRNYGVIEKRYALFPQKPGTLTIPAIGFDTEVASSRRGGFALDIFNRTSEEHLESEALQLVVKPQPANAGEPWLPARGLRLKAELTPAATQFMVGDPLTWTISLEADGLSEAQLPPLQTGAIPGAKSYPDAPALSHALAGERLIGKRVEKIALLPTTAGTLELPEIRVPWWNIETQRIEVAVTPARQLTITASPATTPTLPAQTPAASPSQAPTVTPVVLTPPAPAGYWPWLTGAATLAWLATLALWWFSRHPVIRPKPSTPIAAKPGLDLGAALKASARDDAQATRQALERIARSAGYTTVSDWVSARASPELEAAVQALHAALYAGSASAWRGNALRAAVQALPAQRRKPASTPALAELYSER